MGQCLKYYNKDIVSNPIGKQESFSSSNDTPKDTKKQFKLFEENLSQMGGQKSFHEKMKFQTPQFPSNHGSAQRQSQADRESSTKEFEQQKKFALEGTPGNQNGYKTEEDDLDSVKYNQSLKDETVAPEGG